MARQIHAVFRVAHHSKAESSSRSLKNCRSFPGPLPPRFWPAKLCGFSARKVLRARAFRGRVRTVAIKIKTRMHLWVGCVFTLSLRHAKRFSQSSHCKWSRIWDMVRKANCLHVPSPRVSGFSFYESGEIRERLRVPTR